MVVVKTRCADDRSRPSDRSRKQDAPQRPLSVASFGLEAENIEHLQSDEAGNQEPKRVGDLLGSDHLSSFFGAGLMGAGCAGAGFLLGSGVYVLTLSEG